MFINSVRTCNQYIWNTPAVVNISHRVSVYFNGIKNDYTIDTKHFLFTTVPVFFFYILTVCSEVVRTYADRRHSAADIRTSMHTDIRVQTSRHANPWIRQ